MIDLELQARQITERVIVTHAGTMQSIILAEIRRVVVEERRELQHALEKARVMLAEAIRTRPTLSAETFYAEARSTIREIDLTLSVLATKEVPS